MQLGSDWLAHAYLIETGLIYAKELPVVFILQDVLDLISGHCVTKGNVLPVAFHIFTFECLRLVVSLGGH